MSHEDPDEYFLPLEDQRVFGAGIRRKRVKFVPASHDVDRALSAPPETQLSAGDRYLSIVLNEKKGTAPERTQATETTEVQQTTVTSDAPADITTSTRSSPGPREIRGTKRPVSGLPEGYGAEKATAATERSSVCEACGLPIPGASVTAIRKHEASLAHQVSLPHSNPPSAIDRSGTGFKYLSSRGWDPDSRLGLGSSGQGILQPLRPKVKKDTVGLGIDVEKLTREGKAVKKTETKKLNAKEVRNMEKEGKKKDEKLRRMFYMNDDVAKHLAGSSYQGHTRSLR